MLTHNKNNINTKQKKKALNYISSFNINFWGTASIDLYLNKIKEVLNKPLPLKKKQTLLENLHLEFSLTKDKKKFLLNPIWGSPFRKVIEKTLPKNLFNNIEHDFDILYKKKERKLMFIKIDSFIDKKSAAFFILHQLFFLKNKEDKKISDNPFSEAPNLDDFKNQNSFISFSTNHLYRNFEYVIKLQYFLFFFFKYLESKNKLITKKLDIDFFKSHYNSFLEKNTSNKNVVYSFFLYIMERIFKVKKINKETFLDNIFYMDTSFNPISYDEIISTFWNKYNTVYKKQVTHLLEARVTIIMKYLVLSGVCVKKKNEVNRGEAIIGFNLKNKWIKDQEEALQVMYLSRCKLPMISLPKPWKLDPSGQEVIEGGYLNSSESLVHTLKEGRSTVKFSPTTIESINKQQSVGYPINKDLITILELEKVSFMSSFNLGLLKEDITRYNLRVKDLSAKVGINNISYFLTDTAAKHENLNYIKKTLSKQNKQYERAFSPEAEVKKLIMPIKLILSDSEFHQIFDEIELLKKEKSRLEKLQSTINTKYYFLEIAKLFVGYTVYFVNFVDFRLRIYPASYFFNRTSGFFKYLLLSRKKQKIDKKGLDFLKIAIVETTENISLLKTKDPYIDSILFFNTNIEPYLLKKKGIKNLKNLLIFLNKDPVFSKFLRQIKDPKNYCLFIWFILEYVKTKNIKNYQSRLILYLDHTSSAGQIYSIFSSDFRTMAQTNVISKDTYNDVYYSFYNFFIKAVFTEIDRLKSLGLIPESLLKIIEKEGFLNELFDRKAIKGFLMPMFYGLTKQGAFKKIFILFLLNLDYNLFSIELKVYILEFCNVLVNILFESMHSLFPEIMKVFFSLKNFAQVFIKNKLPISFKTLDGTIIEFCYTKQTSYLRTFKSIDEHLIGNKPLNYRKYLSGKKISNKNISSFPANYLQHADAFTVRTVLHRTDFDITSIHDSYGVHPNNLTKLTGEVKNVYIDYMLNPDYHFIYKVCFESLSGRVPDNVKLTFDKEWSDFLSTNKLSKNKDKIKINLLQSKYFIKLDV